MKKLTKLLSAMLVCLTVFSSLSLAAEGTLPQEEATSAVSEESTAPAEEETTPPAEDETTTTPEEESTEPEKPEVILPEAPKNIRSGTGGDGVMNVLWDEVEGAEGYDVYLRINGEWVLRGTSLIGQTLIWEILNKTNYEVGVVSYITVDGVKYESEMAVATILSSERIPVCSITVRTNKDGVKFSWSATKGVTGLIIYIKNDGEWEEIRKVDTSKKGSYIYEDVKANTQYYFASQTYVENAEGIHKGSLKEHKVTYLDFTKAKITSKSATSSSVTLKWSKVEDADGYRVYVYKNNKWTYYKGIKTESYTVKSLEDATNYKFKVKAFFKEDGKTIWGTYSDEVTVRTDGKKVKSYRVGKLKKYFTDGDWSVKVTGLKDEDYGTFDYTLAVKDNKIFVRYDFKNNKNLRDFEYLIDADKEKVYAIFDDDKTYTIFKDDDAYGIVYSVVMMAVLLDMSDAKGVTAKTSIYSGKKAVAEIYTDKELGIKKTYYFVNDEVKALKVAYADGSTETMKISKINDTPSSSVFKIPSGYKKVAY